MMRANKTEGGIELFDQSQARALEVLRTAHTFVVFAVGPTGGMKCEATIGAFLTGEELEAFFENMFDALEVIQKG